MISRFYWRQSGRYSVIREQSDILEILKLFVEDIEKSIYTSFGFSVLIAFFAIYFYLFAFQADKGGRGGRKAIISGCLAFIKDKNVRHFFLLALYTAMVLFRTLLNRKPWPDPLSKLWDGWWIWDTNAEGQRKLSSDFLGNIVMLMPMTALSIWTFPEKFRKMGYIKGSLFVAGGTSLLIETMQLAFRLGTFQISDLVYNTAGGVVIGIIAKSIRYRK